MASLNPNHLYSGDNGRLFCGRLRCAGTSAHYSGRDLSGQKVEPIGPGFVKGYYEVMRSAPTCECCGREQGLVVLQ